MSSALPERIQKQVVSIKNEGGVVTLFFSTVFQLDYVKSKYEKDITSTYQGKLVRYEVAPENISGLTAESQKILNLLRDQFESKLYPKDVFETTLALFSNPDFLKDCNSARKRFIELAGKASLVDARDVLLKEGIEEKYFIKNLKIQKLKESKKLLKGKGVLDQLKHFDDIERLAYYDALFSREFEQKDLTGASYVSSSDTVSDYVVEGWVNHYPPRFYSLPYEAKILIASLCENYGLRHDIYGDMLMDYIFTEIAHPIYACDLPNEQVPPARILFSDIPEGFSELKVQLYHDSELDEVIKLLKSKWDVIKRIQRDLLPPEKWKRTSKTSLKNLERDAVVVSAHSYFKNYKETRSYLLKAHGISLTNDNLYQIIRRHNKVQKKLSTPRYSYDLQYLDSMLKKPRKKGKNT